MSLTEEQLTPRKKSGEISAKTKRIVKEVVRWEVKALERKLDRVIELLTKSVLTKFDK